MSATRKRIDGCHGFILFQVHKTKQKKKHSYFKIHQTDRWLVWKLLKETSKRCDRHIFPHFTPIFSKTKAYFYLSLMSVQWSHFKSHRKVVKKSYPKKKKREKDLVWLTFFDYSCFQFTNCIWNCLVLFYSEKAICFSLKEKVLQWNKSEWMHCITVNVDQM